MKPPRPGLDAGDQRGGTGGGRAVRAGSGMMNTPWAEPSASEDSDQPGWKV